jgi:8-oxo-dGTP pyrophosphatase MutT (NUDIX family)
VNVDAVPVCDAATVLLVRDSATGLEVFLLRRRLESGFVPGAHVFPGGAVDPDDHDVDGVDPFVVAAIRETFEEAGALLAYDDTGDYVDLHDPAHAARFDAHRRAMNAGTLGLVDLCKEEGLTLAVEALVPFSRWVTPSDQPRRYDTCFFVVRAPAQQALRHDGDELVDSGWFTPADALRRYADGTMTLIRPTKESLEDLVEWMARWPS